VTPNIGDLSGREAEFLAHLAGSGRTLFSVAEAHAFWNDATYVRNVLSRLVRKGWLQRLERGRYMVIPLEAGPKRTWSEDALVIASHLIQPAAVAYWSALHYWAMTEHVPHVVLVQSTRRKRSTRVAGVEYRFVAVSEAHFFGVDRRTADGKVLYVTDREKTLLDAAVRPDLSGGIGQLVEALETSLGDVNWERLDGYLVRWGGGAPVKRLGYLVEALDMRVPERKLRLQAWQAMISRGVSALEPGGGHSGPVITRWQVQANVAVSGGRRTSHDR
jgi:predicted transcriptional regulator of viral defense system